MSRNDIARKIAEELLDNGVLDENNFNYNTDAILEFVQGVVLNHLRNYSLLAGAIF